MKSSPIPVSIMRCFEMSEIAGRTLKIPTPAEIITIELPGE